MLLAIFSLLILFFAYVSCVFVLVCRKQLTFLTQWKSSLTKSLHTKFVREWGKAMLNLVWGLHYVTLFTVNHSEKWRLILANSEGFLDYSFFFEVSWTNTHNVIFFFCSRPYFSIIKKKVLFHSILTFNFLLSPFFIRSYAVILLLYQIVARQEKSLIYFLRLVIGNPYLLPLVTLPLGHTQAACVLDSRRIFTSSLLSCAKQWQRPRPSCFFFISFFSVDL